MIEQSGGDLTAGAKHQGALLAAVEVAFGALLSDDDVESFDLIEGEATTVTRRARREVLSVNVEEEIARALLAAGVRHGLLQLVFEKGHALSACMLGDGRWMLRVKKARRREATVGALIEEGLLTPEAAAAFMEAVLAGEHLLVRGPCQSGAERLATAIATQACEAMRGFVLAPMSTGPLPPLPAAEDDQQRWLHAHLLGASFVLGFGLTHAQITGAADAGLMVVASTMASISALTAIDGVVCITLGFSPAGAPEIKSSPPVFSGGEMTETRPAPLVLPGPASSGRPSMMEPEMLEPQMLESKAGGPSVLEQAHFSDQPLPPLKPLPPPPPAGWAPADEGPGWELGDRGALEESEAEALQAPSELQTSFEGGPGETAAHETGARETGAKFDAQLRAVQERPSFMPAPPSAHPQTRALQRQKGRGDDVADEQDPFGGLTLEPPPGGKDVS